MKPYLIFASVAIGLMALSCKKEVDPDVDMWLVQSFCNDNCIFANDGECDDGVEGSSTTSYCDYGTDCTDCGVRIDVRKRK